MRETEYVSKPIIEKTLKVEKMAWTQYQTNYTHWSRGGFQRAGACMKFQSSSNRFLLTLDASFLYLEELLEEEEFQFQ